MPDGALAALVHARPEGHAVLHLVLAAAVASSPASEDDATGAGAAITLLSRVSRVSALWRRVAMADGLWKEPVLQLFQSKAYICENAWELAKQGKFRDAYFAACRFVREPALSEDALCALPAFHRRMKACAGEAWTARDPYWVSISEARPGEAPRARCSKLRFLKDGSVETWDDHTPASDNQAQATDGAPAPLDTRGRRWRFAASAASRGGPHGSCVRMSEVSEHGTRRFPTFRLQCHPETWAPYLESCWAVLASWPLSPDDAAMDDSRLQISVDLQRAEALAYNVGIPMPEVHSMEERDSAVQDIIRRHNADRARLLRAIGVVDEDDEASSDDDDAGDDEEEEEEPAGPVQGSGESSASAGMPNYDALIASNRQFLERSDARWNKVKRRFDRALSASIANIALGMVGDVDQAAALLSRRRGGGGDGSGSGAGGALPPSDGGSAAAGGASSS